MIHAEWYWLFLGMFIGRVIEEAIKWAWSNLRIVRVASPSKKG